MAVACDVTFDEMAVALSYICLIGGAVAPPAPPAVPAATDKALPAKKSTPEPKVATPAPTEAIKEKKVDKAVDDDEVDDLFDDDDAEEAPTAPKPDSRAEKMAAAKAEKDKKKKIDKSQIVFEVKPWDADQDLKAVFHKIVKTELDGLAWGEAFKLVPVAFGVRKLVLSCVVEDDKVGVEDITDIIEAFEDEVQSVDMTTMNRL